MTIDRSIDSIEEFEDEELNTGSDKVYQNYMMPGLELYDSKVSINHWQLRDCVKHSSTSNGTLYYMYNHSIRELDTNPRNLRQRANEDDMNTVSGGRLRRRSSSSVGSTLRKKKLASLNDRELCAPSHQVAEFNFKPRCFSELNGLIVCGGLNSPDDKGFPTNWDRLSKEVNNGNQLPPPANPIALTSNLVLQDHTNYSNQNLWKGILSIHNIETGVSQSLKVGQFINNCVALSAKSNHEFDLYSCNNDNHMYQVRINNRDITLSRRFSDLKFALNNVSLSNDSQTMVVSGDSNKFAIYRKNEFNGQFSLSYDNQPGWGSSTIRSQRIPRFAMSDKSCFIDHIYEAPNADHGFYSSFSENDLQFATLFQNGVCLLYDVRKMEVPLAEINSTRPYSHSGAFRVCKFSYGLDDLLFISEHQGRVHVIDTRNLTNHQVIMVPDKVKDDPGGNDSNNELDPIRNLRRRNISSLATITGLTSPVSTPSSSSLNFPTTLRRRYSFPVPSPGDCSDDSTTFARSIPLEYLEPKIFPYPKIANRSTNEYNGTQRRGLLMWEDPEGKDRRSSYRVRRVSTSSNRSNEGNVDSHILNADATEHISDEFENDTYMARRLAAAFNSPLPTNGMPVTLTENDSYPIDSNISQNDISFRLSGRTGSTFPPSHNRDLLRDTVAQYSTIDFTEENNISGLTWMEDTEASSLAIGTDYGIMKWNINSWARRSFASYDFC